MFDVGFSEVVIIAIIALVILGPERLPKVARTLGFWVGKARRMVADVKSDIDREMRESELADLRPCPACFQFHEIEQTEIQKLVLTNP